MKISRVRRFSNGMKQNNKPYKKWAAWTLFGMAGALCLVLAFVYSNRGFSSAGVMGLTSSKLMDASYPAPASTAAAMSEYDAFSSVRGIVPATGGGAAQPQPQPWDRMIIRTATLQLTIKDVGVSVDRVQTLATLHGGYVTQSESSQEGEQTVATITIQVPSGEFDKIMPELRKLDGQVTKVARENISSSDVTEEYTDLQSQLRNLQATETRMLALQGQATKLEDVLTLDRELRQIQGEIERIQGRLNFLGKRSEMSTIAVSLYPEAAPIALATEPVDAWQPGEAAAKAWNASLEMLAGISTGIISVAVFLWWAVPFLAFALLWAMRSRKRPNTTVASEPS